jgi:hypothetical protein
MKVEERVGIRPMASQLSIELRSLETRSGLSFGVASAPECRSVIVNKGIRLLLTIV